MILAVMMLPALLHPQSKPGTSTPAATATIVKYEVLNDGGGPLRVLYSDGAVVQIPKERGRVKDGNTALTQEAFSEVQIADDRVHVGWLADYLVCAQSYACHIDLVILRRGQPIRYVSRSGPGVVWGWTFLNNGAQVVVESGFPHGDALGRFELFDSDSGQQRETFVPDPDSEKPAPQWVEEFRSLRRRR
jgi:hypothetical protein